MTRHGVHRAKVSGPNIRSGTLEFFGLLALVGLVVFFTAVSWRKWPSVLIDFGRELYLPWRLANGAVLYRDVDDFFGPLSQYFNAALFKLFGPGLMVLVTANLLIFAGILVAIYSLCRRAWGVGAALASSAIFIAVFGFSQLVFYGNYNYATPYAHEATHGFLVCLLLVIVLIRWVKEPTRLRSLLAGGLLGLSALLKPEILLAAGLVTLTAMAIRLRQSQWPGWDAIIAWAAGVVLPTLGFVIYFAVFFPWTEAVTAACRGWLNVIATTRFTSEISQRGFIGFDKPWENFVQHVCATLLACFVIALVGGVAWLVERHLRKELRGFAIGLLISGLIWLACFEISWILIGRCLLGLVLIYTCVCGAGFIRTTGVAEDGERQVARLLLAVLAVAMMARMVLNGRIYQYGFYQAALAGLLVPAVLIGELPVRLGTGRIGRTVIVVGALALLVPGVVILAGESHRLLHIKTFAVGEGADRFYTYPPEIESTGEMVSQISKWLRRDLPGRTLVVLPEGEMLNYLARVPSSVSPFMFFAMATRAGGEERIVNELQRHPPDLIVVISMDLREFGVEYYGERSGSGQQILHWVAENYELAAAVGGDPLDYRQRGYIILKRKGE